MVTGSLAAQSTIVLPIGNALPLPGLQYTEILSEVELVALTWKFTCVQEGPAARAIIKGGALTEGGCVTVPWTSWAKLNWNIIRLYDKKKIATI